MSILHALYDHEINFRIETLWKGVRVSLGDEVNGFVAEANLPSLHDALRWLADSAAEHFPDGECGDRTSELAPLGGDAKSYR